MSAPLQVDSQALRDIAVALDRLSAMTVDTGVRIDAFGPITILHGEACFQICWVDEAEKYQIDDRIGS